MKNFLFIFLLFLLPFAQTVYFIQDLQGTTLADFNSQIGLWTSDTSITLGGTMTSNGPFLEFKYGYPASQAKMSYSGIDDHSYMSFSLGMEMRGPCSSGDILDISFDGIAMEMLTAHSWTMTKTFYLKGRLPHSGNSIEFSITSKLTSSCQNLLFGIRDLSMSFFKTLESTDQKICHTLTGTSQLRPVCSCILAQRGPPCKPCSTGCSACDMTSLGVETCSRCNPTSFYEWNGEGCETCESKCAQCAGNMGNDCSSCLGGYFKYADGTCAEDCPSPFKKTALEGGYLGGCAVACGDSEWLYRDLTCKDYCDFKEETDINGIKWCKSPCENEDDYYYEENKTCEGGCPYPDEAGDIGGIKLCSSGLDEGEVKQIEGVSKAVNGVNAGSDGAIKVLSFLSSSDSSSIFMSAFSKMLQYIKYMNIAYPAKVELMLEMTKSNASTEGFASKMMRNTLDKFPNRELSEKFEYYGAKSSFFVNYWPSLFILLILLTVTILLTLLNFYVQKPSKLNQVLTQITGILKWNMVLLLFCGDFGDIVFFTALEVTTTDPDTIESSSSLLVCIIINIIAFWVLVRILTVNFNIRKSKLKKEEIETKWGSYKTFFAIYRDQSYFQQIFMFIFIVRVSIFNAVIGYLFNYPLVQAILIALVNLFMLLYLIFKRPMKALINFIQQVVLEGFLLVFNICICILAGLEHNGAESFDFRDKVGEVMVVINIIVPIVSVVLLGVKVLILGVVAYNEWNAEKIAKKEKVFEKDFRIQKPSRQVKMINEGDKKLEADMMNKSNCVFDMGSSDASFVNNSNVWGDIQANERDIKLNNPRWRNAQISNAVSGQSTGYSPNQQPFYESRNSSPKARPTFPSPARQFLKKQRIKRNKSIEPNDNEAKNGRIRSDFAV